MLVSLVLHALLGCNSVPLAADLKRAGEHAATQVLAHQDALRPVVGIKFGVPTGVEPALHVSVQPESPSAILAIDIDRIQRIDFETALVRANLENPTIARFEEAVRARLAERLHARSLLLPTLDVGGNFRLHRGALISGRGIILQPNSQSLYYGFGADTKGGGTVAVPGVRFVAHLGDAFAAPRAADARVAESRFDADAARNTTLLEVGTRYVQLVEADARVRALKQTHEDVRVIEQLTAAHVKAGQGRDADHQRALAELLLVRGQIDRAAEDLDVASAELARLLDMDPSVPLRPMDQFAMPLELIDSNTPLPELIETALANHPEIAARNAAIAFQEVRLRQERARPWLPVIAMGFSVGEFGGSGTNTVSRLSEFSSRIDADILAVWSLQNLGAGNRAVQGVALAGLDSAVFEQARAVESVRRNVAEAHARLRASIQAVELARTRVELSQASMQQDLLRIKNVKGLPLEVLRSVNQLGEARLELIRAAAAHDRAQLQLFTTLGNTPAPGSERVRIP
jgi:outer membrane protein TolC